VSGSTERVPRRVPVLSEAGPDGPTVPGPTGENRGPAEEPGRSHPPGPTRPPAERSGAVAMGGGKFPYPIPRTETGPGNPKPGSYGARFGKRGLGLGLVFPVRGFKFSEKGFTGFSGKRVPPGEPGGETRKRVPGFFPFFPPEKNPRVFTGVKRFYPPPPFFTGGGVKRGG